MTSFAVQASTAIYNVVYVVNMLDFRRAPRALPQTALQRHDSQTTSVVFVVYGVGVRQARSDKTVCPSVFLW